MRRSWADGWRLRRLRAMRGDCVQAWRQSPCSSRRFTRAASSTTLRFASLRFALLRFADWVVLGHCTNITRVSRGEVPWRVPGGTRHTTNRVFTVCTYGSTAHNNCLSLISILLQITVLYFTVFIFLIFSNNNTRGHFVFYICYMLMYRY